jgi:hypothetical protein
MQEPKPFSAEADRLYDEYVADGAPGSWQNWLMAHEDRLIGAPANTRTVRYHSSDDMAGLGELAEVTEPVAVVLRGDGSVDVYGYVAVVDQRAAS